MTLRQHAACRLAAAVMRHEGKGWLTKPSNPRTLPQMWFRREQQTRDTQETPVVGPPRAAVFEVAMGNCSEEHCQARAVHWFASSGVAEDDPSRLNHGQEGSFGCWGSADDTGLTARVWGSLALDFKLPPATSGADTWPNLSGSSPE
jgi:hypothetical protein